MELVDQTAASALIIFQLAPPSVVLRMVPAQPTAQPLLASRKKMPSRACVVLVFWTAQVRPPSAVAIMAPFMPVAQPWSPMKATSISFSLVPELRATHFAPPSSVARTVPPSPMAIPRFASRNAIARSGTVAPVFRESHLVPPSVVYQRVPCSQSAYTSDGAGEAASRNQQEPYPNTGRTERSPRADTWSQENRIRISICSYKAAQRLQVWASYSPQVVLVVADGLSAAGQCLDVQAVEVRVLDYPAQGFGDTVLVQHAGDFEERAEH